MRIRTGMNTAPKLMAGRIRKLTLSEIRRGYLFVTKVHYRKEFIEDEDLLIVFNGRAFPHRRLDDFGRAMIGKEFMRKVGERYPLHIRLRLVRRDRLVVDALR